MIDIDWERDYRGEFVCPRCGESGLRQWGKSWNQKISFKCFNCGRRTLESHNIKLPDPNSKVNWHRD